VVEEKTMQALAREQGKFVSRAGLRKVAGPSDGQYALIIVDSNGCPVSALTEWYRLRQRSGSPGTRRTYLGFLLPFFGYLLAHGLAWNSDPEQMHRHIRAFLRDEVVCQVSKDTTLDGYLVELTGNSPVSQSSLRVLLAAIRDFYVVMAEAGLYPFPNPMCSPLLQRWKRERIKQIENAGAPDHAGIRGVTWGETQQQPTAFFRQRRGKPWQPDSALTSEQIQKQLHADLDQMIQHVSTQRDRLILLLLRYTGARLHEILGLTAGGYRKAKDPCQAYVLNKGSLGREEKVIRFPQALEAALVRYIRTERVQSDACGRKCLSDLADTDPIFLTRRGTAYGREAFYFHWRQWYNALKQDHRRRMVADAHSGGSGFFEFTPHDIRHLRVTEWMTNIHKQCVGNEPRKQLLRRGMQRWMGWRSERTIACYDHSFTEREAEEAFDAFQREVECSVIEQNVRASSSPSQQEKAPEQARDMAVQQMSRELDFWEDLPS
jgi:site-specific recombinase XerD